MKPSRHRRTATAAPPRRRNCRPAVYSSSWLRRRAAPLMTRMFSWAARSTMALRLSTATLCAISAQKRLRSDEEIEASRGGRGGQARERCAGTGLAWQHPGIRWLRPSGRMAPRPLYGLHPSQARCSTRSQVSSHSSYACPVLSVMLPGLLAPGRGAPQHRRA